MDYIDTIIATINAIETVDDETNLRQLDQAIQELFHSPHPEQGIDALFRIFERFPHSDGYGLFWTILHHLESLPDYHGRLIESVRQQPMEFNLMMVNRLLNGGTIHMHGTYLLDLLEEIAANPSYTDSARAEARSYVESQQDL